MTLKDDGKQKEENTSCSQTQEKKCCPSHLLLSTSHGQGWKQEGGWLHPFLCVSSLAPHQQLLLSGAVVTKQIFMCMHVLM